MEITKLEVEVSTGKKIFIRLDDLSNPLKRKLRKEIQRFINPNTRQAILEPVYNEGKSDA